jgi:hypothetical protein
MIRVDVMELSGTHHQLIYADDIHLLVDGINTKKDNSETLLETGKDVDLEINTENTKYMIMSRYLNLGKTGI